jgi:hypothetical protein
MNAPFSKYPSADALIRPRCSNEAKGGVSRPGLKMTSPVRQRPRYRLRARENLWQCRHIRFACFTRRAFCVCSAREDSRSDNVQDPASSNPPISAGLILSPSYLVSARSSCLQTAASGQRFRAFLPRGAPNRGSYLRSPRLKCQPSQNAKNLYDARSKPTAISAPPPLGIYRSSGG